MRSFKNLLGTGRVLLFWSSVVSCILFIIAGVAALVCDGGGFATSLVERVWGEEILEVFPKRYFILCLSLVCLSYAAFNFVICMVTRSREENSMNEKIRMIFTRMAYWFVKMVCAIANAFVSIGLGIAGVAILYYAFSAPQAELFAAPCALASLLVFLVAYYYAEYAPVMPARWENFFLRAID
jgi:hypothetical protein